MKNEINKENEENERNAEQEKTEAKKKCHEMTTYTQNNKTNPHSENPNDNLKAFKRNCPNRKISSPHTHTSQQISKYQLPIR